MNSLHPNLIPWLKSRNGARAAGREDAGLYTPEASRADVSELFTTHLVSTPHVPLVRDEYLPAPAYAAQVRIYHPRPAKPLPVLVYFHGGGFVAGGINLYEPICRKLALASDHIVICPEYRLAPEAPYPAAIIDALGALKYLPRLLVSQGIPHRPSFSVAGDSAGAALATIVAARARRDISLSVRRQVLITPWLDFTLSSDSMERCAARGEAEKEWLAWCLDQYLPHAEDRKALSPLYWEYGPGLAESLVVTAEFSCTRDEGLSFVKRLRKIGARADHLHFDDMPQNFLALEDLVPDACRRLYEAVGIFLQS